MSQSQEKSLAERVDEFFFRAYVFNWRLQEIVIQASDEPEFVCNEIMSLTVSALVQKIESCKNRPITGPFPAPSSR